MFGSVVVAKNRSPSSQLESISIPFADRLLTLPRGQFRASLAPNEFTAQLMGEVNADRGLLFRRHFLNDNRFSTTPTVALGLIDNVELGMSLPTIAISPSFFFNNMSIYGRYALSVNHLKKKRIAAAIEFSTLIPVRGDYGLSLAALFRIYMRDRWRVDFSPKVEVVGVGQKNFAEQTGFFYPFGGSLPKKIRWNVFFPISTTVNFNRHIFLGFHSGFGMSTILGDNIRFYTTSRIHAGFQGGYTLLQGALDLVASVTFPYFYVPFQSENRLNADVFELNIGAIYRMKWFGSATKSR